MNLAATEYQGKYLGKERRHHRMFVTRNSEYHCRDGVCVAVRSLDTGEFVPNHRAIGRRISSSIRFGEDGELCGISRPEAVQIGDKLCFRNTRAMDADEVITSTLRAVERPPKEVLSHYVRI